MKSLLHDLHCQHDKHKKNAIFILKIAFFLQAILTSSPCVATSKLGDESRSQTEVCFGSTHLLPIATFRLNAVFLWPWKLIILPRQCQASQFRDEDRREDADLWKVAHRRFETVDAFARACILNLDSPRCVITQIFMIIAHASYRVTCGLTREAMIIFAAFSAHLLLLALGKGDHKGWWADLQYCRLAHR